MGINNRAPISQPRNVPANRPLSSRRLNNIFEEMLRDLAEIFNSPLPDIGSLKTSSDKANNVRFQGVETADALSRGGTEALEEGDHTEDWRYV